MTNAASTAERFGEQTWRTSEQPPVFYTAKQIAAECGVSDASVRNRWYPWLLQAVPERYLKTSKGYTFKAYSLFLDYRDRVSNGTMPPNEWVAEVKRNHAKEWSENAPQQGRDQVPEGSRITFSQTALAVRGDSLLDEVIDVEFRQLDTTAIDAQTEQYGLVTSDLMQALEAKALNQAEFFADTIAAKIKNTVNRKIAGAYRELV